MQNPKSKIPKIQNPQNPQNPKSQNPHNPKSKIPKIPKSKIQNPQNPKSKIPKIQNPKSPKSKIQVFLAGFWGFRILDFGDFGFWIWDSCPNIQNPNSPKSKIQNPQNPKSKIPKIQNPKSSAEIQNLGRWGPHVKNCFLMMQNPKSKIPKIRPKKLGFWILDFGDFGFWDFGDFGFWIVGILDFGLWDFEDFGFWILGILGILDFGILGILDFGDFGDFGDLGFWGFWILGILDFGILGRSRGCTTRQFGDGAWRSEARTPPGLPLGATSKPTVSNSCGKEANWTFFQRSEPYKITEKPWLPTKRSELYKITEKPRVPTHNPFKSRRAQWSRTRNPPETEEVELPLVYPRIITQVGGHRRQPVLNINSREALEDPWTGWVRPPVKGPGTRRWRSQRKIYFQHKKKIIPYPKEQSRVDRANRK